MLDVRFLSHNRKAQCMPDPAFPDGLDVDLSREARASCQVALPYPAECCGVWLVACAICGVRVGITAAGRPDDPRSVKIPCHGGKHQ